MLLASEMRTSSSGHRLRIEFLWDAGLLLRAMPGTGHGYAFGSKQPANFIVMHRPQSDAPRLVGMRYVSGRYPLPSARLAFRDDVLQHLRAAVEGRPELHAVPCAKVRSLISGREPVLLRLESSIGLLLVEEDGDRLHIETEGIMQQRGSDRHVLAVHDRAKASSILAWSYDINGVRRMDGGTALEIAAVGKVVDEIFARRRRDDYAGQRQAPLPESIRERYGVASVHELVERLNANRARQGRPRLPAGSYPTSMVRLRSFMRLVEQELPLA